MSQLTLKEAAGQYAWQLGQQDYPAQDRCPYSRDKSPRLYKKYWSGWKAAAEASSVGARVIARGDRKSAAI